MKLKVQKLKWWLLVPSLLKLKITVAVVCRHENKIRFLPAKKAMTSLDKVLKRRDITLPTVVHRVSAMFFPVVMYRCES